MSARSPANASDFAYTTPTSNAPARPGPAVTATASMAERPSPASASARSTTAGRAARCARLASSGTTPPKILWMSCERMTRLASSPFTRTAADVSSHEVSIPRTTSATARRPAAAQRDGIGNGARGDAARRHDGDPGNAAARSGDVGHHAQGIARQRLHALLGTAHVDRDPRGSDDEARDRARSGLHRNPRERTLGDEAHLTGHGHLLRCQAHDTEGIVSIGTLRVNAPETFVISVWTVVTDSIPARLFSGPTSRAVVGLIESPP